VFGRLVSDDGSSSMKQLALDAVAFWPNIKGQPQLIAQRENTIFRVETDHGPAALRIHRSGYHSSQEITSELSWMAHLAEHNIKVPAPIATKDGTWMVELKSNNNTVHAIDVLNWLDGEPLGKTSQPLAQPREQQINIFSILGAEMARLHNGSDAWERPPGFVRHAWDRDGLVGENPFWGRFWELSNTIPEETDLLVNICNRLRRDLDQFNAAGADYGLIHADLVRENILVDRGNIHMIDFDDAGYGFRLFDIATALLKNRREPHYEALKAALIDGYRSQRQLPQHALENLPMFLLLRALTYLGWAERRKNEQGMDARMKRMKADALELARDYLDF
jgi:Ser/Thr protein kinase RdoA (MazF antagonist)